MRSLVVRGPTPVDSVPTPRVAPDPGSLDSFQDTSTAGNPPHRPGKRGPLVVEPRRRVKVGDGDDGDESVARGPGVP
jgi:hypothetical protein